MRISNIQSDILFILLHVEKSGVSRAIPGMSLLKMINDSRSSKVADTNFRTSCHTLNKNGLLTGRRGKGLTLHWILTPEGRARAIPIYEKRTKEMSSV